MRIEHIALNVPDILGTVKWYTENLGLTIVRQIESDHNIHFLGDDNGRTLIEVYSNSDAAYPDYGAQDPFTFHIALVVDDMDADRQRLIEAGASAEGDVRETPGGDQLGFVRDPWGVCLQLVKRKTPLG